MTLVKSTPSYEMYRVAGDAMEVSKAIYESGWVKFCTPNFLVRVDKFDYFPNDTYSSKQWYLHNTGQTVNEKVGIVNADIDAPAAWGITKGNPSIVVAVVDEGITANHPDLPNSRQVRLPGSNFAAPYDGTNNPNNPSPTYSLTIPYNHGNACAGIIAASQDNNEGVTGIAPLCKIMPIKIFLDENIVSFPENVVADAINFAVANGANIISCSWGVSGVDANHWPVLVSAIENALEQNRIVAFAIGNNAEHSIIGYDGHVSFPANNIDLINKGMVVVGASDRKNKQANYSPNTELGYVVAPSHTAYWDAPVGAPQTFVGEGFNVWTMDIPDNEGNNPYKHFPGFTEDHVSPGPPNDYGSINPSTGNNNLAYTAHFGGTSAATPEVAAVAALMLSVNPCLGNKQIKDLLQSSADKVGGYDYNWNPNKTGHSMELGYGKINAHKAVVAAQKTLSNTLDLYTKDNINDLGTVGINGTGGGGDQSPDIWVRNQEDGLTNQEHQNPEFQYSNPAYVYVRVRNKSCQTSTGNETLSLYWHKPVIGGSGWLQGWDGTNPNQGGPVAAAIKIPVVQPGAETILMFEWNILDPNQDGIYNACLLSRIENVQGDPILEYPSTQTHLLINENNNVSIKNVTIVDVQPGFGEANHGFIWAGNSYAYPRLYNIDIAVLYMQDGFAHDITREAEVRITFDVLGWDMLQQSGNLSKEGIHKGGERQIIITQPNISLGNLVFPARSEVKMDVQFNFLTDKYTDHTNYQLAVSMAASDKPAERLGTETFMIRKRTARHLMPMQGTINLFLKIKAPLFRHRK